MLTLFRFTQKKNKINIHFKELKNALFLSFFNFNFFKQESIKKFSNLINSSHNYLKLN